MSRYPAMVLAIVIEVGGLALLVYGVAMILRVGAMNRKGGVWIVVIALISVAVGLAGVWGGIFLFGPS